MSEWRCVIGTHAEQCGGRSGAGLGELKHDRAYPNSCCTPLKGGRKTRCERLSSQYWQCNP